MQKKGQATVFVILGIVIIVIIGLFLYLGKEFLPEAIRPADFDDVGEAIQNCIDGTLVKSKDYFEVRKKSTVEGFEKEIEKYFMFNLNCDNELSKFSNKFKILVYGSELSVEAQAVGENVNNLDKIVVTVNYPIIISKGENQERFDTFVSEYTYSGL